MDNDEIKTVTVSLLGESFTLRCHKSQADSLQRAVGKIQEITSKILRDNPSLTPQQAAIIAAIESQPAPALFRHLNAVPRAGPAADSPHQAQPQQPRLLALQLKL